MFTRKESGKVDWFIVYMVFCGVLSVGMLSFLFVRLSEWGRSGESIWHRTVLGDGTEVVHAVPWRCNQTLFSAATMCTVRDAQVSDVTGVTRCVDKYTVGAGAGFERHDFESERDPRSVCGDTLQSAP